MAEEFRGKIGGLSDKEVEDFLATDALARFACLKPDGAPYVIPLWYQWDGEALWFVGRQRAVVRLCGQRSAGLRRDLMPLTVPPTNRAKRLRFPRCSSRQCSGAEEPNVGGKWCAGRRGDVSPLSGPQRPHYLVPTLNQPRWLIKVVPEKVRTWQGVAWARPLLRWRAPAAPAMKR